MTYWLNQDTHIRVVHHTIDILVLQVYLNIYLHHTTVAKKQINIEMKLFFFEKTIAYKTFGGGSASSKGACWTFVTLFVGVRQARNQQVLNVSV